MSAAYRYAPEDLAERFRVLKRQELTSYRIDDYLNPANVPPPRGGERDDESAAAACSPSPDGIGIEEDWRIKMCEWSCELFVALIM